VPRIRNVNATGDIWNRHTGFLAHGESVEVSDDIAAELLEQVGNFELDNTADTED
jgi:hypothetical protein